MEFTLKNIKNREDWRAAGFKLPEFDDAAMAERTRRSPVWLHFGAGNIFRAYIAALGQDMLDGGHTDRGIIAADTFDYEIIDKVFAPYENRTMLASLRTDGRIDKRVIASVAEAIRADSRDSEHYGRLAEIFRDPGFQMASFTITEKGYNLLDLKGEYSAAVVRDFENGPSAPAHAMSVVAALMFERFKAGAAPFALVSMDNCSQNGAKLRASVLEIVAEWEKRGFVPAEFTGYMSDEERVSFPWTMIDKITPRPAPEVGEELLKAGFTDTGAFVTSRDTYVAPFVNAEVPQYLVIEDRFPSGRPPFEKVGVYMTDRETVDKVERMKVMTCLNPLHTALGVFGTMLGFPTIASEMGDPQLLKLVERIGYDEGMPVVVNPGIISPQEFIREVLEERFPNPFLLDTPERINCDVSQKVAIRFGETIKAYMKSPTLDAGTLTAIPLAIAGLCRYLLGVTDDLEPMELSSDPTHPELYARFKGITPGGDIDAHELLAPVLSNAVIFGADLYEAGIGEKIEGMFTELSQGRGAVRRTLVKYLG